ncbi:GntR family transcriptional regulator [Gluconacetobacter sacchari DSM 12717]|uniref:PLP-dependent aminotransferase family protein n=2 Tax=Gluconacetobacter sacchari TaxID=92759 RepID=A0A7W4IGE0_9PROT|nr:PLP-dependent aminotransferase family protein [Gluconacetobacter sacchari]MBB2162391.1 PLP-dependent aminotransferase family protein [Gluconacetobacter sacchari]GBQ22980.1 GntR family transcriptional regulator [Gluconacetobacter sacchari DSM 12717]
MEWNTEWFVQRLHDRSVRGLVRQLAALVQSGALPVGTRLPAIRDLAYALEISPATVSIAWGQLRRRSMIDGRGRSGMFVIGTSIAPRPVRRTASVGLAHMPFDLTSYTPDVTLLPSLASAFAAPDRTPNLNVNDDEAIVESLRAVSADSWPYDAEDFMGCDGGYSGLYDTLHALVPPGSIVAVEDPTPMRVLDILDHLGASILPVRSDLHGPMPDSLERVVARGAVAVYLHPGLNAVTGRTVPRSRLESLAAIMTAAPSAWIIEDDPLSRFNPFPSGSLGAWCPDRVVHIRSLSAFFGPDLRVGIISATARIIREICAFRSFGPGCPSRLLQSAAAWMAGDAETTRIVAHARQVYAQRRACLAEALARLGHDAGPGCGFSLWLPVREQKAALACLAHNGIRVTEGSKCSPSGQPHIRLSFSHLVSDQEWLAGHLVAAGLLTKEA